MIRLASEEPLMYEVVQIIYDGKSTVIDQTLDYGKSVLQFKDIVKQVDYRGGMISVWAENRYDGALFRFGHNGDAFWKQVGETRGYA